MTLSRNPPRADQLEVTLIGPGFGECCLLHFGDGRWILIDSCVDNRSGKPAAIEYLDAIGVPYSSVEWLIATHWHDDHVAGIAETLKACSNAKFCASAALTSSEFIRVISAFAQMRSPVVGSGVDELMEVITELKKSKRLPYIPASFDTRLVVDSSSSASPNDPTELWTLSPSAAQITKFLVEIAAQMPALRSVNMRLAAQKENHLSVVTLLTVGDLGILLGGDLEETKNNTTGWTPIVQSTGRPRQKSTIFKVPHHGSRNGHCEDVWNLMLVPKPIAIGTRFTRGRKPLPSNEDQKRINALSRRFFLTSGPLTRATAKSYPPPVRRTLRDQNLPLRAAEPSTGMVRLRNEGPSGIAKWHVELDGAAHRVTL